MSDKLKKLRKDKSEAYTQLKQFEMLLKMKTDELVDAKLTKEEEKSRIDLTAKKDKLSSNFAKYKTQKQKLQDTIDDPMSNPDEISDAMDNFDKVVKAELKNVNNLKVVTGKFKSLTDKFSQSSKIKESHKDILRAIVKQIRDMIKIEKEIQKLVKNLNSGKGNQDKINQITSDAKKSGSNKTVSELEKMKKMAAKYKAKLVDLRQEQHKKNKDKNPQKEKIKKQLKKGSIIKNIQELNMLYNQVLDVVPIRIIIEEALRCLLKKIGFDQWRRELCRSGLKALPWILQNNVILPLFKELARFGCHVSSS